ncbi:MAG TPA: choice-of-anchor tandem repeat GloVer-containing protein [Candidatus Binatia bacterium]|nr:choice-of-anchor tandem repeat GloVer-containing protein [Candidatus Binatia bacterium]
MDRRGACVCFAAAVLTGCGGSQSPSGAPGLGPITSETVIYSFAGGNDGAVPAAAPIVVNGAFYGTTVLGGNGGCVVVHGCGTVYAVNSSAQERVLHVFTSVPDGEAPGSLIESGGNLLGTTTYGGDAACKSTNTSGCGTIFEASPSGSESVLYSFAGNAGGAAPNSLTPFNGTIYGEAAAGGAGQCYYADLPGCGLIFEMNASGTVTTLYTFAGGKGGGSPQGGLLPFGGNLYGTTSVGGGDACNNSGGCGTVFEMTPSGSVTVLHGFGDSRRDGAIPATGLVALDGDFYGSTLSGGNSDCAYSGSGFGCGTIFEIAPSGKEKVLYNFTGGNDGEAPNGLIVVDGNLYGTTAGRGAHLCGTLFKLTPAGLLTTLYQFRGGSDGCGPGSALVDVNGTLYGTTTGGGAYGHGTLYGIPP